MFYAGFILFPCAFSPHSNQKSVLHSEGKKQKPNQPAMKPISIKPQNHTMEVVLKS